MTIDFHAVENATEQAVKQGVFPGAVLLVGRGEDVLYEQAFGWRSLLPDRTAMRLSTLFDLSSLTKPLATTLGIMLLVNEKKIHLDDQVTQYLPAFANPATKIRHLLNHTSGLPAWKPYYERVNRCAIGGRTGFDRSRSAKSYILEQVHRETSSGEAGTQALYSDLGFMVLGEIIEIISGSNLDLFFHERISQPLKLSAATFVDLTQPPIGRSQPKEDEIAPTELCPWRKKVLCGEVHDDNAFAMGGVAGHAGLFSSARDIHAIVTQLDRCLRGCSSFLPQWLVHEFFTKDDSVPQSTYALGWDTPAPENSSSGLHFSRRSVGHLGFTGTSLWWDLEKNCHVILLTNRVHPNRNNEKIKQFRPKIHDLIMQAINP
ncbi:MAG TPA: serine hydrolase [Candidatus Binatia bacterium]